MSTLGHSLRLLLCVLGVVPAAPAASAQACADGFRVQFEVRDAANQPVKNVRPGQIRAVMGGRELIISRLRAFDLRNPRHNALSMLLIVLPRADVNSKGVEAFLSALRRQERVAWRIAVLGPDEALSPWVATRSEQEGAVRHAFELASRTEALPADGSATGWLNMVEYSVKQLATQPGRVVAVEVPPPVVHPRHPEAVVGEDRLHTGAALVNIPVYRWSKSILDLETSLSVGMPLGDASFGGGLAPSANAPQSVLNELQMSRVREAAALQKFGSIRPFAFDDVGGRDVEKPQDLVHRIVDDAAGSYRFAAPSPSPCTGNALYPLRIERDSRYPPVHVYAPHFVLETMTGVSGPEEDDPAVTPASP